MSEAVNNHQAEVFVVVPSYNHAPFIEDCLASIIEQTQAPKKLLVIDDGSRDESPAIIERVLKNCPFDSELIARENRGLCATLNEGLSVSDGEYFAYLGSDDLWLPRFLEERSKLLNLRKTAVLGYGHSFFADENGELFDCTANYKEDWASYADGNPVKMLLNGVSPISSTVFYRRSALENVRWNKDSRLEDYEMYVSLMSYGEFAFDPQVLSVWRHHNYNTSKNLFMMHAEVLDAQKRHREVLGVTEDELDKIQAKIKFRYLREFLQRGDKKRAIALAKESWRAADSPVGIGKALVQFLTPNAVLKFYRKRRHEKQIRISRQQRKVQTGNAKTGVKTAGTK
jgi:alpha-1,3-rhamnosyltransferase